ncbi:MAG: hypothetical protein IT271_08270 [Chitinophagales bacterium]|nr:hypothetical protein [Chitinophagales bacterium]
MQIPFSALHAQDTIATTIIKDSATINVPAIKQDSAIYLLDTDDTLTISPEFFVINKKETRVEKTKKAFKFISYFNYSDRGYGKDFSGVEKYEKYAGKKITCVDVVVFKPFGCTPEGCPVTMNKGQRFGNAIHFKSKEWYIRGDIFFKEGDVVNPTLFADTEKLLWERKKFKDVKIIVFPDSLNTDEVEVMIFLQDRLSWSMSAGYYNGRVVFSASTFNFFGLPNTLNVFGGINFNKYNLWAVGGTYKYENIQASQINFTTSFVIEKLNQNVAVSVNRKFFNLKTALAFNAQYVYNNSTLSLNGNLRDPSSFVNAKSNYYSLWLAGAIAVNKLMPCKDDKLKFIVATKLNYIDYKTRPFIINRNYNEIFIRQQNYRFGFGIARWDFYLEKNAFYIDIAEYFPRGISASVWAGPQFDEIYGRRAALNLSINYGIYFKKFGFLYPQVNYSGYIRNKKGEQMQTAVKLDYVSKKLAFAKHMYFRQILKGGTNLGFFIPEERYFNINDMNGIRGFYSPSLKGSKSITLSVESDLFLDKIVALSKGMVYAFCDMGWLSENGKKLLTESKFQYGIGTGIRIRSVDLGLPYLDFQFSFYPRGKDFGAQFFQFKLYEQNINAVTQNNMFVE